MSEPFSTIEEVYAFCAQIKVKPAQVYIASNGAFIATFNSSKHSTRYGQALTKHLTKLGYTGPGVVEHKEPEDVADWELTAYTEMLAPRH